MYENESLLNDIRKGLAYFESYIKSGQGVNLTDTNVRAEDFVANLLNLIFGWKLENVNNTVANYPCIDLIDESLGHGVQVTGERGSLKICNTIRCLVKHDLGTRIQSLKVFCLVSKQSAYTINESCDAVKFDWKTDVLDFNDLVRESTKISHLDHLKSVRQHVVESFPSIFPEFQARLPSLTLPATDPKVSWLPFSSKSTKLVGRDDELKLLLGFVTSSEIFSWWLILGAAGSGKSRLALELCGRLKLEGWAVGFLNRTELSFEWQRFNPNQKTLIVIDYIASRHENVSDAIMALTSSSSNFKFPVRVLLLERNRLSWWPQFIRLESPSESAQIMAKQHSDPTELPKLGNDVLLKIAKEVVLAKGGNWEIRDEELFLAKIERHEFEGRPLYAMILAEFPNANDLNDLLRQVLAKERGRRKTIVSGEEERRRMENLLIIASIIGRIVPLSDGLLLDNSGEVSDLLPSVMFNENAYCDFAGSDKVGATLSGLQPDLLGERFVLDSLNSEGVSGQNSNRLFRAACRLQPDEVIEFALRAFVDFKADPSVHKLLDVPLNTPEWRVFNAKLISQLFGIPNAMLNEFSMIQLDKLIEIADGHIEEEQLQTLVAVAEYNLGCRFLFAPRYSFMHRILDDMYREKAGARFDNVISRVGNTSRIGIMALLNRGGLFQDVGKEIQSYTTIIDSDGVNDETRACALNNRANCFMEREEHENAIVDRTSVIMLNDTSADRRFVALFRRAESFAVLRKFEEATDDLTVAINSIDINIRDKLQARLQRGVYAYFDDRITDTRNDFNAVNKSLQNASRQVLPKYFPDEVSAELTLLIEDVLQGMESDDPSTLEQSLEDVSKWISFNTIGVRISKPEMFDVAYREGTE